MKNTYLAADFGGGSGRVIAGNIENGKLIMEEIHRFPNRQIKLGNHLYWDFLSLFEELKTGMKIAAQKGFSVRSIGIDTWGVDFGLIDKDGNLVGNPVCYRDKRTDGIPSAVFKIIDEQRHYAETGIQVMAINTLFQLYSIKNGDVMKIADKLLFMPDLFVYFLTGTANNEYSIASTSELLDAKTKSWSLPLIHALGLPEKLFGNIILPGTKQGTLKKDIAHETGLPETVEVIAVASHDTASSVLAVPSQKRQKVFLSSGTWSLLGVTLPHPVLTEQARQAGFTNEGGVGGIRFLQNITGLWILQQLMKVWTDEDPELDYEKLIREAENAPSTSIIDVDDSVFVHPDNMREAIVQFCKSNNCILPQTRGEFARCVLESLAERYKKGIDQMQRLIDEPITELHIIGGGSKNRLLNQLTANKLGITVVAGPTEATAMGNILMQAWTAGEIQSEQELTDIVKRSAEIDFFVPL